VPPQGANRGRFASDLVDQLIDNSQSETNPQHQAELFRMIQEELFERLPYIPLWYENHVYAAKDSVTGYRLNMYGNYDGLKTSIKNNLHL
jgi:peptide/nickel transport system substrate-binding protein